MSVGWLHLAGDTVIALSCFVITAALGYLAHRHYGLRVARIFALFALLFFCGGWMHVCEAGQFTRAGVFFKLLTALSIVASALMTVRCIPAAQVMFARLAVQERWLARRVEELTTRRSEGRARGMDAEGITVLTETRDLMRTVLGQGREGL